MMFSTLAAPPPSLVNQQAPPPSSAPRFSSPPPQNLNPLLPTPQPPLPPPEENAPTPAEVSLMRKALCRGIIETKNDVEVLRKDPNSPLYSIKTFEALNLRPELLKGIYEMGFKLPSKIQETALPMLLADP